MYKGDRTVTDYSAMAKLSCSLAASGDPTNAALPDSRLEPYVAPHCQVEAAESGRW